MTKIPTNEKKLASLTKKFQTLYAQGMRTDARTYEGPDFRFWSESQRYYKRESINRNKLKLVDINNRCLDLAKQIVDIDSEMSFIVTQEDYNKTYSRRITRDLEYAYSDFVNNGYVFVVFPVSY